MLYMLYSMGGAVHASDGRFIPTWMCPHKSRLNPVIRTSLLRDNLPTGVTVARACALVKSSTMPTDASAAGAFYSIKEEGFRDYTAVAPFSSTTVTANSAGSAAVGNSIGAGTTSALSNSITQAQAQKEKNTEVLLRAEQLAAGEKRARLR